jgi:hypothetical protein
VEVGQGLNWGCSAKAKKKKKIHSHISGLQAIQRYRYSAHFPVHRFTRTKILSLHQSYPGNGYITVSLSFQTTHEDFFSQPNSFLTIILQLPIPKTRTQFNSSAPKLISRQAAVPKLDSSLLDYSLYSRLLTVPFYNPSALTTQKT